MELTEEEVEEVESVRETVLSLINIAEDSDSSVLDEENLRILEVQLDGLHQALSLAVAQKETIAEGVNDE